MNTRSEQIAEYALRHGDDALITAQRLAEWVSNAPELEEDMALANISLDQLGIARGFLQYAGSLMGKTEDELAYFRDDTEFRCAHLVAQPRGDFADTVIRLCITGAYQRELFSRLAESSDPEIAAVAAKAVKEVRYHLSHGADWAVRLGHGTEESARRLQQALSRCWPYVAELFDTDALDEELAAAGVGVRAADVREPVLAAIGEILAGARLSIPEVPRARGGGRHGQPSEHLAFLLAEMQVLARAHPGATW